MTARGWKAGTAGDYGLTPVSEAGTGKTDDPEKQRPTEINDWLNDLNVSEVSDDDKLNFANCIGDRIGRGEWVMAQIQNHSEDQVMHGLFPKKVTDAVSDYERLNMPLLGDEEIDRPFAFSDFEAVGGEVVPRRICCKANYKRIQHWLRMLLSILVGKGNVLVHRYYAACVFIKQKAWFNSL
ncbi:hypothetical protein [Vreelandella venusta]|uniref:hypothetical protein n=1 Tax=Vreelandella venusta TaxID=44935 RepID=UPI003C302CD5